MSQFTFRPRTATRRIILHDSHTPHSLLSAVLWMRAKGRTMGLLEVGYHYVIERDGRVVCTRPHTVLGSHTPGFNHDAIGVCVAGGLDGKDDFSADQMEELKRLLSWLLSIYPGAKVQGHSELGGQHHTPHQCPAFDVEALRKDLMKLDALEPTPPEPQDAGLSPQNQLVLDYLKGGRTLSTLIAMVSLGVGSLSSRVAELRKQGHKIKTEEAEDHHGRRYLKYTLSPDDAP